MTENSRFLSVEEAAGLILNRLSLGQLFFLPGREVVPVLEAVGRICGEDVFASMDQPPFDRSPLDGYAACHEDLAGAGREHPAILTVSRTVYAGDGAGAAISRGEAVRIMTGAPVPEGADCVVRQEDTDQGALAPGQVSIFVSLDRHENYCFRGEDIRQGEMMLHQGEVLTPAGAGLLASQGMAAVTVFKKPGITVISTGSELAEPGTPLQPGWIYDSNRILLTAYAETQGARIIESTGVPDDPQIIAAALQRGLDTSDLVVTTGGVSVGQRDYMEEAGARAGARILFHGVMMKPGGPMLVLEKEGKLVICLSGNPFGAFATFVLFVRPALFYLQGRNQRLMPEKRTGVMKDSFPKASPGRRFVRALIRNGEIRFPARGHASGMIASLAGCNCLIDIPAGNQGLKEGDQVEVVLF